MRDRTDSRTPERVDLLGVGLGPFNLGLAALTEPLAAPSTAFVEADADFRWHPGMLIEGSTIQLPFMADLVTLADPTSPYSFLAYLKACGRLYSFYIREDLNPLRAEYERYCRWVSDQLQTLHYGERVVAVERDAEGFVVTSERDGGAPVERLTRHLALGIGTEPSYPAAAAGITGTVVHSGHYLQRRDDLAALDHVTVVGSGQSAAEIYHDLLQRAEGTVRHVAWVTRSPRFFPMEYTKLTLEMTSPDYARYHRELPEPVRAGLARSQRHLYKGISSELVDAIYDTLYRIEVEQGGVATTLATSSELRGGRDEDGRTVLDLHHLEQDRGYTLTTDAVVLSTGYTPRVPAMLDPVLGHLRRDERGRLVTDAAFRVDLAEPDAPHGRVYMQNGDEHVHSLIAPDLGMGAWRNSVILADLLGEEIYPVERRIAFQDFGVPAGAGAPAPARQARHLEVTR